MEVELITLTLDSVSSNARSTIDYRAYMPLLLLTFVHIIMTVMSCHCYHYRHDHWYYHYTDNVIIVFMLCNWYIYIIFKCIIDLYTFHRSPMLAPWPEVGKMQKQPLPNSVWGPKGLTLESNTSIYKLQHMGPAAVTSSFQWYAQELVRHIGCLYRKYSSVVNFPAVSHDVWETQLFFRVISLN